MSTRVSVCMVTYNHAPYIAQAIQSALAQETDFDFEIVVGDDASTDGTSEILRELQAEHPHRVRALIREKNIGAHRNFRDVFLEGVGDYIAILDGDDFWTDPKKLQKQCDFMDRNREFSIVGHRVEFLYADEAVRAQLHTLTGDVSPEQKPVGDLDDALWIAAYLPTRSMFLRRSMFPGFPEWHGEVALGDWTLLILMAEQGRIGFMNEVMATQRMHGGGVLSGQQRMDRLEDLVVALQHYRRHLGRKGRRSLLRKQARIYQGMSRLHFVDGHWVRGAGVLLKSWGTQILAPEFPRIGVDLLLRKLRQRAG